MRLSTDCTPNVFLANIAAAMASSNVSGDADGDGASSASGEVAAFPWLQKVVSRRFRERRGEAVHKSKISFGVPLCNFPCLPLCRVQLFD